MTGENMSNLDIWGKVKTTDPKYTKDYKGAGGFSGTSINAHYMIQKATEVFGPCGDGWGYEIVDDRFDKGGPLASPEGKETIYSVMHTLRLSLWYMKDGERKTITHYGHTPYISANKFGIQTDMEAPKKSLTDALKKCLSMLGFGADVFMGQFDDIHYVTEARNEFEIQNADSKVDEKAKKHQEFLEWLETNLRLITTAQTMNELKVLHASAVRKLQHRKDDKNMVTITKAYEKRSTELNQKAAA